MAIRGDTNQGNARSTSIRSALESISSVFMIGAACIVVWSAFQQPKESTRSSMPVPSTPLPLAGSPLLGDNRAPVVMMVFSDFQCVYCARLALEILPELRTKYIDTGLVQLVIRHLPMSQHQFAARAAQGSVCAGEQGKFWLMHDALFRASEGLNETRIRATAEEVSIDLKSFDACIETPAKKINDDLAVARKLQLNATPMLLFGLLGSGNSLHVREIVAGARSAADLAERLDALLKEARHRS